MHLCTCMYVCTYISLHFIRTLPSPSLSHPLPLNMHTKSVMVTLQSNKEQMREHILDDTKTDKIETVNFSCPQLGHLQLWHHIVVTMTKTLRQKSKVSLFMDGVPLGVQKVHNTLYANKTLYKFSNVILKEHAQDILVQIICTYVCL